MSKYLLLVLMLSLGNVIADDSPTAAVAVKKYKDVVYAEVDGAKLKLNLFVPETASPPPLVVWIHGGGWRAGSREKCRLQALQEDGFAIASISYRFTDVAIFPAQVHDCKAAVRWLRANSKQYGFNPQWIGVAGSSAGGHLALMMGVSAEVKELEGTVGGNLDQSSRVQAVIDYFGPSDFVLRGKTQPERAYTNKSGSFALLGGTADGKVDSKMELFASPTTYVSKDDAPLLIFHGTADKTVLLDQSERIDSLYKENGLQSALEIQEGAGHGAKQLFSGQHFESARKFLLQSAGRKGDSGTQ